MSKYLDNLGRFQYPPEDAGVELPPDVVIFDLQDLRTLEGAIIIAVKHIGTGNPDFGNALIDRLKIIALEQGVGGPLNEGLTSIN